MESSDLLKLAGDALALLSPLLALGIAWVAKKLGDLIKVKVDNQALEALLVKLNHGVFTVVKELQQTMVEGFRKASADGKLSQAEKDELKAMAMSKLKSYLSFEEIGRLLGAADVDGLVASKVEAAVHELKRDEDLFAPLPRD